ncbi:hypothetical protein HPODL_03679 [Ogataea parapolymorpha DL-1]|uniref:DUF1746 domain-containing protein n=1 Tax=Ogataea parapolymorpha (strain ATCC 26012 / BCRC 20466 / JCM 22074 / NRRL Y-7560 / DL-1) TaxID=871575 RepID=W1QED2_OGAPD|nr:hypothetical protein HPODL_03679 [Ogataea parapolymorpha DL-1]ESW99809.1 hypothetical protein HPODL_03679 [Ogataea parapolymorpha DL-1]
MNSSMPGSFPGSYDSVSEQRDSSLMVTQIIKVRNSLKLEFLDTLNILLLLELIVIYLQDQSFFKLVIRISLQLFLAGVNSHTLRQWIEYNLLSTGQTVTEETLTTQLIYFQKAVLVEVILINSIALADHLFFYRDHSRLPDIPHDSLVSYLNLHTQYSIEFYESKNTFRYNSIFINIIGEARPTNKTGLLILDVLVFLGQYITYSLIYWPEKSEPPKSTTEQSLLLRGNENEMQEAITIFNVELFPATTFTGLWSRLTM